MEVSTWVAVVSNELIYFLQFIISLFAKFVFEHSQKRSFLSFL